MWSLVSSFGDWSGFAWSCACLVVLVMALWMYRRFKIYLKYATELIAIGVYFLVYLSVRLVQRVVWSFNGVNDHKVLAENGDAYDNCVQVLEVIHRGRVSTVNYPKHWDLLGLHQHFTHPGILLNPKITLYSATQTHAYFVEVPEEVDVHSSKTSPFMYMAQFEHATRMFSIPLCHFHRLAQEVGNPKVPVLIISSCGRCGSTLVIQMMENLPGTRCMSEPDVTTNICLMDRAGQLPPEEISRLLQSSMRILCKEHPGDQRIVIKTRFNCSTELPYMQEIFPEFKHIYLYRNMGQVLKSYYKFLHRDTAVIVAEKVFNSYLINTLVPFIRRHAFHLIAGETSRDRLKGVAPQISFAGMLAACVGSCVVEFQKHVNQSGKEVPTLHYDELMRSPLEVTTRLFQVLDLPSQYVQLSLAAMQHDTQQGTILSNMASNYNKQMTGPDVKDSNMVLSMLGLPGMNQKLVLSNPVENPGS